MVVAKRQRKEKAYENGTKENPRTGVKTSGETALLASPIYIGQAGGWRGGGWQRKQMYKRRKARQIEGSSFGLARPHASRMYFPLLAK